MKFLRILIISLLMSLSCSYIIMSLMVFASPNAVMTGRELLEEVTIAIGLGLAISVVSLIFEIERLPFGWQFILHFLSIVTCVFTAGYFGQWYDFSNKSSVLIILVLIIIIYAITWWLFKIFIRKDVDALNKAIQQRKGL